MRGRIRVIPERVGERYTVRLSGPRTFDLREEIKSLGGTWEPLRKSWRLSREAWEALRGSHPPGWFEILLEAQALPYCHSTGGERVVTSEEAARGFIDGCCPKCGREVRIPLVTRGVD